MAIENVLIAKITAGVVSVGGLGGVGYVFKDKFLTLFTSNEDVSFLVVKTNSVPSADVGNLFSEVKEVKKNNFFCDFQVADKSIKDEDCNIYKIPEKVENKLNDIEKIKSAKIQPTNNEITTDKYFVIKTKNSLLENVNLETTTTTINLTSKTDKSKNFGVFNILYKISKDNILGKTNLVLAYFSETIKVQPATGDTFTCQLKKGENDVKQACIIHKFVNSDFSKYKDIAFTADNVKAQGSDALSQNTLYLVDLKNQKFSIKDLLSNPTIIYKKTTSGQAETEVGKLTIKSVLSHDKDTFDVSTSNTILFS